MTRRQRPSQQRNSAPGAGWLESKQEAALTVGQQVRSSKISAVDQGVANCPRKRRANQTSFLPRRRKRPFDLRLGELPIGKVKPKTRTAAKFFPVDAENHSAEAEE